MIDLPDQSSQLAALGQSLPPDLNALIKQCLDRALANDLADLTHILVIEPGDIEADIIQSIGFNPLASRIDGIMGQPDWDWIEEHPEWWQLTYCIGNDGFASIVFVGKAAGTFPELAEMCQRFSPT